MHVNKSVYQSKWDTIGISASLLCAVHCVVLPFFISTLPFLGVELLKNVLIEAATIITSLLAGCWALLAGYRKHHHQAWPILLFVVGMLILLASTLWLTPGTPEIICKALAAGSIITAHVFNWKYSRGCPIDLAPNDSRHG